MKHFAPTAKIWLLSVCLICALFSANHQILAEDSKPAMLDQVNSILENVLFFDVSGGIFSLPAENLKGDPLLGADSKQQIKNVRVPLVVLVLFLGGIFFTIYYRFVNFRGFRHAIKVVQGKYDCDQDAGEVSHFRALTSALSATVGLGNIAGVAIAIQMGGPGAAFWMCVCGVLGMSSKFNEVTLAQMYRRINKDGSVSGGPMYYLDEGFKELGGKFLPLLGKLFALTYGLIITIAAIGGGCMFQANQTVEIFSAAFSFNTAQTEFYAPFIGGIILVLCAAVILGGIQRIGSITSRLVPLMCGVYVLAALVVILANFSQIPTAVSQIFYYAFNANAFAGGIVGVLVAGVQRASFSNEAGLGSASIAHAAAKSKYPVREGYVSLLEPFIDTVVICLLSATLVIITGAWSDPQVVGTGGNVGVSITAAAFKSVLPWFPYVLTVCVFLFAYSTMISWCYYGERGWIYVVNHLKQGLGEKTINIYRLFFCAAIMVGAVNSLDSVINFTDMCFLSLAIPNIIGSLFLVSKVKTQMLQYEAQVLNK